MQNLTKGKWRLLLNLILGVIILSGKTISAQDTLILKSGVKMIVAIKEVNDKYVLFSLWPDSTEIKRLPLDFLQSSASGIANKKYSFNLSPEEQGRIALENLPKDTAAIQALAKADVKNNFNKSHGVGIGTCFATIFGTPVVGLATAIPMSKRPPVDEKLNPPSDALFKNKIYYGAYRNEAHRVKKIRIWTGFGIGVVVDALLVSAIIYSWNHMDVNYDLNMDAF